MLEIRSISFEIRSQETDGKNVVAGVAAPYNKRAVVSGKSRFTEQLAPKCFSNFGEDEIFALWMHDPANLLGRSSTGSLKLENRDEGLAFELVLPNTTLGRDVWEQVKCQNCQGVSVGMNVLEDKWEDLGDYGYNRTVLRAKLVEISLTPYPVYDTTSVTVKRSFDDLDAYYAKRVKELVKTAPLPTDEELFSLTKWVK
jgi:HK97 family phage prohead protease